MKCPPEVAVVVSEILHLGLVRTRAYSGAKESKQCYLEADHLHNLPGILADYVPERLSYYWECERPSFMEQVPEAERRDFQPLWDRLEELIDQPDFTQSHGEHAKA